MTQGSGFGVGGAAVPGAGGTAFEEPGGGVPSAGVASPGVAGSAGPVPVDPADARAALLAVRTEVAKAVVGQDAAVTGLVIALLSGGHVLLEGVPGVAKTLLVRSLAAALALDSKRVQFTPDLMPGDVTGSPVFDSRTAEFSFREGPVFTNLLLADEINRTPRRRRPRCWRRWRSGRSPSTAGRARCRTCSSCRDAEPGRVRGHLPAPRGAAGPLPAEAGPAAARARRGDRHPGAARRRLRSA